MRARSMISLLLSLIAPWALATPQQQTTAPAALQGLDAYVRQVMHDWHVPGLAIAVVKDGKVVLARGYGVRELGKPGAVDADTLFDIASNTKAFTVAALGTLVASGKLKWDTPVVDVLKDFRLSSPYVTENITLRDLLTHRTGYCDPAAGNVSDDEDILARIRFQQPAYGFRATFCYNNIQYFAAGRFVPTITGTSWNDYVAAHLFQPLGMNRTVSTEAGIEASTNVAAPHGMVDNKLAVIHRAWPHNQDITAAVGGIWSSADDMSHWLQMLLADGRYDGETVLDSNVIRTMETPQVLIQQGRGHGTDYWIRVWMPGGSFYSYGLGFFIQHDYGHTLVWHAGDDDGMASALALVPDAHLGVVVVSNSQGDARFAIIAQVLQDMLDRSRHDIEPALLAAYRKYEVRSDTWDQALASSRVPDSKVPLPLADYAGTYADKLDGDARVSIDHGHLVLRLGNPDYTGDLEPWHGNTFRVTWSYRFYGDDYATFDVDALGKPAKLSLDDLSTHYERVQQPEHAAPNTSQ